jgi:hypothetical protein
MPDNGSTQNNGLTQIGVLTPLRPATLQNLQLNAGIFIRNLDMSGITNATDLRTLLTGIINGTQTGKGSLFGATRGGGTFTVTRDMRTPDIDGMRYRFKKGQFVDSVDAYLSTTLVELGTEQNIVDAMGGTLSTTSGGLQKITMNTELPDSAYIDNVCWVGEISNGTMILILLKNAVNIADFSMTFADKNEGTLAVEFHACQEAVNDYATAPFEVYKLAPGIGG